MLDTGRFESTFGFRMPHWEASVKAVIARLAKER
jgi:dTDP-4-dehydrorhamnose reductase